MPNHGTLERSDSQVRSIEGIHANGFSDAKTWSREADPRVDVSVVSPQTSLGWAGGTFPRNDVRIVVPGGDVVPTNTPLIFPSIGEMPITSRRSAIDTNA